VGNPHFGGESGHEEIATGGERGGGAAHGGGKRRQYQQAARGERRAEHGIETRGQAAGGADDDGLGAAEQDAQAFLFHRRVKTADHGAAGVAPVGRLIVGAEDCLAGAVSGAEKSSEWFGEQRGIAEGEEFARSLGSEPHSEPRRPAWMIGGKNRGVHVAMDAAKPAGDEAPSPLIPKSGYPQAGNGQGVAEENARIHPAELTFAQKFPHGECPGCAATESPRPEGRADFSLTSSLFTVKNPG